METERARDITITFVAVLAVTVIVYLLDLRDVWFAAFLMITPVMKFGINIFLLAMDCS